MRKNIVTTSEQIIPIGMSEWYSKQHEIHQSTEISTKDAFNYRQCGRIARCEAEITSNWNTYLTNTKIAQRIIEITSWYSELKKLHEKVETELKVLLEEKFKTEHELDQIFIPLQVITQCISIRDSRRPTELTKDDATATLTDELNVIEKAKEALTQRINLTHEKLDSLENMKHLLKLDLEAKNTAIDIDRKNLVSIDQGSLYFVPDNLDTPNTIISYESWLEHCRNLKNATVKELSETFDFKNGLRVTRNSARNDIKVIKELTDFALRKRIHQTRKVKSELEWHKFKVQNEMGVLFKEVGELEKAIFKKDEALKYAQNRYRNRQSRPKLEHCRDEVEESLREEIVNLQQIKENLTRKYQETKQAYKNLEAELIKLEKELDNKGHSLMTDVMCLDTRSPLDTGDQNQVLK